MGPRMKALVKDKPEPGLTLRDEPVPVPGPEDVLVKVHKTGICGTDIHIYGWDEWAQKTIPVPMVVGHEYAGEIVELGAAVRGLKIGQRVSGEGHVIGMKSRAARGGRFHLDPETRGIGVNIPGAFAEYVKVPAFNIVPLPDDIDDELGAILDPLGNAVHTALSFDLVGEDVLITGAGPIGIMSAAVARHVGARHVVITDVNPARLALAAEVADVTPVDVSKEDLRSVAAKLGLKEGFRRRPRDERRALGHSADGRQPRHGRQDRHARHSRKTLRDRLDPGGVPHADHQGHLWPRDVRDLVQDAGHAAIGPRCAPGDHAPFSGRRFRPRLRGDAKGRDRQGGAGLGRVEQYRFRRNGAAIRRPTKLLAFSNWSGSRNSGTALGARTRDRPHQAFAKIIQHGSRSIAMSREWGDAGAKM